MPTTLNNSLLEKVIYHSAAMQTLRAEMSPALIHSAKPLFLWGEVGSGAAFYAKAVHHASRAGEFLRFCLSSFDEDDLRQDFFGTSSQSGWLEKANQGTIFIRELNETPLSVQQFFAQLLKIQSVDGRLEFPKIGTTEMVHVNVRFMFNVSCELTQAIQENTVLAELHELLKKRGKILYHPPLRERKEDILDIARNFFDEFNVDRQQKITGFDHQAEQLLINYSWPGNIDELKQEINAIFMQYPDIAEITSAHIPRHIAHPQLPGETYSFKFKHGELLKGTFCTRRLKIEKANGTTLYLDSENLLELCRVFNTQFAPPKFRHFQIKLKDGNQIIAKRILQKDIVIKTSFAPSYSIELQELDSILLA